MGNTDLRLREVTLGRAEKLRADLLSYEEATQLSRQGKALSDPNRLTILKLLADAGQELTVSDVCLITGREQAGVSRHLRVLLEAGLVENRPVYRWKLYKPTKTGEALLNYFISHGQSPR